MIILVAIENGSCFSISSRNGYDTYDEDSERNFRNPPRDFHSPPAEDFLPSGDEGTVIPPPVELGHRIGGYSDHPPMVPEEEEYADEDFEMVPPTPPGFEDHSAEAPRVTFDPASGQPQEGKLSPQQRWKIAYTKVCEQLGRKVSRECNTVMLRV